MTDEDFLKNEATLDDGLEHGDGCGMCHHIQLMAQTARELMGTGGTIAQWADEVSRRWHASKYYTLWQEEKAAGRDPNIEFERRGWEA